MLLAQILNTLKHRYSAGLGHHIANNQDSHKQKAVNRESSNANRKGAWV
jgi:hypothetical protein